uniref:KAT8 regulatory NSL complex subunit 1a n=1 Tax=Astyanax mexicanus TaxID=7994 RepID=A0A8B9KQ26_ASTMX
MAAMAPALTDAPAEARHIRLKLAAASSGLSPGSAENNGNATNLLLSSSVSPSTPLSLGKLQPLVASYLCSDVAPVAKESLKVQGVLKSHSLLNGTLFHGAEGGDFLLRKALSGGGQVKSLVNRRGAAGTGGSAMVPVNGLAKKTAVPSTALPEKGCIATVNGDNAKPPTSSEALLPLSSKSGDVMPLITAPRGDCKQQRESSDIFSRAPEDTGIATQSAEVKSETDCLPCSGRLQSSKSIALTETVNSDHTDRLEDPQSSPAPHCPSPTSSLNLEALLQERAQQSRRRHTDISGRLHRLCKRLQVVQAKQVERHVRQQVTGFLDCALNQSFAFSRRADLHTDSLGHFLKGGSVPSELEKLHLSGSTNLRTAEAQFDSDATESSSGGESDVEEEELSRVDIEQRHIKLWRRAEGRFALERASIISRWTWLQAHISDLEYRIRQQADIYRQIRASKVSTHLTLALKVLIPIFIFLLMSVWLAVSFSGSTETSAADSSCTSARVRPLISCKRRRLIQPNVVQNLNGKVGLDLKKYFESPSLDTNKPIFSLVHLCKLCTKQFENRDIFNLINLKCCVVQLQSVLKSHFQTRRIEKLKPLKKLSLKHKLSLFSPSSSSTLSKHKFRLSNSHMAAVSKYIVSLSLSLSLSNSQSTDTIIDYNDIVVLILLKCYFTVSLLQAMKKRKSENSFDINNIVIPMSVAATTRVEKLQYKEIITPSWREVDVFSRSLAEEDKDVEDMSDAAFSHLHQKYEDQERSRWRWIALAPAKRRGSRSYKSLDGRTTPSLSGTNPSTPQPSSPDTGHFHLLQDYGPVPSPLSPPSPDTPCSRDAHTPHSRDAHRLLYSEDTRCSTPDCTYEEKTVHPWEQRSFPLSEDPVAEPPPHHQRLPLGLQNTGHCRARSESEAYSP